jgi:hypothetical protein
LFFTPSVNVFAGLKAGMLCEGILIVVFLEIFLPVFSALVLIIKLPKPLKYTLSPFSHAPFTSVMKASTVAKTSAFSIPDLSEIFDTISAFVRLIYLYVCFLILRVQIYDN